MSVTTCDCGDYTFYCEYQSVTTQVYPLNFLETTLECQKENDQEFYRAKFGGALTFGGQKLKADFTYFWTIEQANPCNEIILSIYKGSDLYWQGYFCTASGEWNLDECTFSVTPIVQDEYTEWDKYGNDEFNILDIATVVTVNCNGYEYTRNRWLWDVIEYLADKLYSGCTVESSFFTDTTNYVTHKPSKLLYLTIAAKSDIKRWGSTDPATVLLLSWNELIQILKMFNIYWLYDETTNTILIEHISAPTVSAGDDLRTHRLAHMSNKYAYTKEQMPKYEHFYFMEAASADFLKGIFWYDSPCVNQDADSNTVEYRNRVTTEIEMIQNDEDSVSDEGFVILANYKSGTEYYTYQGPGVIDVVVRYNMPLSWSHLLLNYHLWNRVLMSGYFNAQTSKTFVSERKNKRQQINATVCETFDPYDYLTTELGETYFGGQKGYIEKAVLKPYNELNLTLLYGEDEGTNPGGLEEDYSLWLNMNELTGEFTVDISAPPLYDIYFSIWSNDDTCDQFTIPAGTMYYEDTLTQVNPIASVKYNFSDASLTGYSFVVDGSSTFDTCTDGDCDSGAPAPPAIPGVPTIIGIGQSSTCGPLNITWGSEAGATYYVLQRKPDYSGNDLWVTVAMQSGTSYDDYDAGTQNGILFTYRLAAGNISGLSGYSAEETFTASC
ncbi:MAG: hypothetical protein ABFC18_03080 [Rikenellaceae bacterium]